MKTWEMIKELTENPHKKFKSNKEPDRHVFIQDGVLKWQSGKEFTLNVNQNKFSGTLNQYEWEEVKQPVTWQEAIQAWVDGKEVICMLNRAALEYAPSNFWMENQYQTGISYREIKEGEWYINE